MKTRIIQDEPDEPAEPQGSRSRDPADRAPTQPRRPGWRAGARSHRKTAIFGWLAFVVALVRVQHRLRR